MLSPELWLPITAFVVVAAIVHLFDRRFEFKKGMWRAIETLWIAASAISAALLIALTTNQSAQADFSRSLSEANTFREEIGHASFRFSIQYCDTLQRERSNPQKMAGIDIVTGDEYCAEALAIRQESFEVGKQLSAYSHHVISTPDVDALHFDYNKRTSFSSEGGRGTLVSIDMAELVQLARRFNARISNAVVTRDRAAVSYKVERTRHQWQALFMVLAGMRFARIFAACDKKEPDDEKRKTVHPVFQPDASAN